MNFIKNFLNNESGGVSDSLIFFGSIISMAVISVATVSTNSIIPAEIDKSRSGVCVKASNSDREDIFKVECVYLDETLDENTSEVEDPKKEVEEEETIIGIDKPVMVTTWDTTLDSCEQITLPIGTPASDSTVDWGNGEKVDLKTNLTSPKLPSDTLVKVKVEGAFNSWGFTGSKPSRECIVSVDEWGETKTNNLSYAFYNADNLKHVESIPSTTTNLMWAFNRVDSNFTIGDFDTKNVTSMYGMFEYATNFNQPINFETPKLTNMSNMFQSATNFNKSINLTDTSSVTNMSNAFNGLANFDQPLSLNTSSVKNMNGMFAGASKFNQPLNFDTKEVTDMNGMFAGASKFNQPLNLNTQKVKTMQTMFYNATDFNSPIDFNDTKEVTNMNRMFAGASKFNQPLKLDTSSVTIMTEMFLNASDFNQPLDSFDTSNVSTMNSMFKNASKFNQDLSHFKLDNISEFTNNPNYGGVGYILDNAVSYNQDLSGWEVPYKAIKRDQWASSSNPIWVLPKPTII